MYAIMSCKTHGFLYDTNWSRTPPLQLTSPNEMLTFESFEDARDAFMYRQCNDDYYIVELDRIKIKEVILNGGERYYIPRTNADRIRGMTDEQLTYFLCKAPFEEGALIHDDCDISDCYTCDEARECPCVGCSNSCTWCYNRIIEWLQEDVN